MSAREKLEHKKQLVLDKSWVNRKKGLIGLTGWLENNRADPALVAETFYPDISSTIAKCLRDDKEGIREVATETLHLFLDCVNSGESVKADFLLSILPEISRRFDFISKEPVEEIRLRLLELVCAHIAVLCTESNEGAISYAEVAGWVSTIIGAGSSDVFPDVKVKAAEALIKLIPGLKTNFELLEDLREHAKDLGKSIVSNLNHTHTKVRKIMVRAISVLVLGFTDQDDVGEWFKEILPCVVDIRHDHSPTVRISALEEFSLWLVEISPKCESTLAQLLVMLIHSIKDEVQAVTCKARECLEKVRTKEDLLKKTVPAIAKIIVEDLGDWSAKNRLYGLRTLLGLADLVDGLVSTFLESVLPLLLKLILDDKEFSELTRIVLRSLGSKVNPSSYLDFFWGHLGKRHIDVMEHFKSGLNALAELLAGVVKLENLSENAHTIALNTRDEFFCRHESFDVREGVFSVVMNLFKARPNLSGIVQEHIFWTLWQIQSSEAYYTGKDVLPFSDAFAQFREHPGHETNSALFRVYSESALVFISSGIAGEASHHIRMECAYLFLVLLRELKTKSSEVLPQILHTLKLAASEDWRSDKQARVNAVLYEAMKVLLWELLASNLTGESRKHWLLHTLPLLKEIFIPQSKWHLGKGHEAKRERSLEVVKLLLELQIISANQLRKLLPGLIPILLSNFDENSKIMRLAVNSTFAMILKAIPNDTVFDDQNIVNVSRALVSRLDDADDEVRIDVIATLILLIPCLPKEEESRRAEEILHAGFIHLDDGNRAVREAAFKLLKAYKNKFSKEFFKEADIFKNKHTHPALVDQLINLPLDEEECLPAGSKNTE